MIVHHSRLCGMLSRISTLSILFLILGPVSRILTWVRHTKAMFSGFCLAFGEGKCDLNGPLPLPGLR